MTCMWRDNEIYKGCMWLYAQGSCIQIYNNRNEDQTYKTSTCMWNEGLLIFQLFKRIILYYVSTRFKVYTVLVLCILITASESRREIIKNENKDSERSLNQRPRLAVFQCSRLCDMIIFEVYKLLRGSLGCECAAELRRKHGDSRQEWK